jgi:NADH-quinone oxidoreductase subunit L
MDLSGLLAAATPTGPSFDWSQHPGLLYVAATLLPLLSFVMLLLLGGIKNAVRPYRAAGICQAIYNGLGGDRPSVGPAYIATVAIGGAFVLCLIGFILFARHPHHGSGPDPHWSAQIDLIRLGWYPGSVPPADVQTDPRGGVALTLGYNIDNLTTIMFLMVTFVATLIHIFSIGYMGEELQETVEDHQVHTAHGHLHRRGRFGRFFMFLSLFCFSMLNLVLADNLFQIFVSWELVGICSYLLIGFYYERQSASNAANKAFITNRIGDAGFIIGLLIVWTYIGTFNFDEIFKRVRSPLADSHGRLLLGHQIVRGTLIEGGVEEETPKTVQVSPDGKSGDDVILFPIVTPEHFHSVGQDRDSAVGVTVTPTRDKFGTMPYWLLVVAGLGIFLGCVGKSAQFPLQVWLPDAMEGPTPVSALIHAATMVAAGVYLVGRVYPMFTPEVLLVIAYTGAITLFVAATIAIVMTDIKKVLAYSTVSQLGYMMLALGVGGWTAGLFHLLTHAFFKALLFLGSGSVIYGCHHEQEMTRMGGLLKKMPITACTMLAGVLAIAGTPLFTGWYSKDAIIAQSLGFAAANNSHLLLFILPLLTAGITTFYMFRMWFLTFVGEPRDERVYEHAHESPWTMTIPLIALAACSIMVAWGWPVWDAEASAMEHHLHHAQPVSVMADFGVAYGQELWPGHKDGANFNGARSLAAQYHGLAGGLALGAAALGFLFAYVIYIRRVLDPAEAKEQFPGVYAFLADKWRFDALYSVILVRPSLVVAGWCRWFDLTVIDGIINWLGRTGVLVSKWNGKFDNGIIDGLANLTADVIQATGDGLRRLQTGYLRSYVLFLVLAAIGLFALLKYFVSLAAAGP